MGTENFWSWFYLQGTKNERKTIEFCNCSKAAKTRLQIVWSGIRPKNVIPLRNFLTANIL